MKLEKIFVFMEPYDYDYRGQGFYIYPWSYNSWDDFQDGLEEKKADYPPEVEEWEFVDSDGINNYCTDQIGVTEKNWDEVQELAEFAEEIGLDIYDIEKVRSDLGGVDVDYLRESHQGKFDSMLDYAYELLDDVGITDDLAERYFSFEKFGYDLETSGDLSEMIMEEVEGDEEEYERRYYDIVDRGSEKVGEYYIYDIVGSLQDAVGKEQMKNYFDYKAFARDLSYDYDEYFGHIWWNH